PDSEIACTVLVIFIYVDAGAVEHTAEIFFGQLAVLRKFRDTEIVRAILSAVRDSFLYKIRDEVGHLRNVLGGANDNRLLDSDHRSVFQEGFLVLCSVLLDRHAFAGGIADDLVVYVGDVHDVTDCVSALAEETAKEIDRDKCAEVADVAVV